MSFKLNKVFQNNSYLLSKCEVLVGSYMGDTVVGMVESGLAENRGNGRGRTRELTGLILIK